MMTQLNYFVQSDSILSSKNVLNAFESAIFAISFMPNKIALKNQLEIGRRMKTFEKVER